MESKQDSGWNFIPFDHETAAKAAKIQKQLNNPPSELSKGLKSLLKTVRSLGLPKIDPNQDLTRDLTNQGWELADTTPDGIQRWTHPSGKTLIRNGTSFEVSNNP